MDASQYGRASTTSRPGRCWSGSGREASVRAVGCRPRSRPVAAGGIVAASCLEFPSAFRTSRMAPQQGLPGQPIPAPMRVERTDRVLEVCVSRTSRHTDQAVSGFRRTKVRGVRLRFVKASGCAADATARELRTCGPSHDPQGGSRSRASV